MVKNIQCLKGNSKRAMRRTEYSKYITLVVQFCY